MNAEIIAVGSEMLTLDRVDTNSLFRTDQLNHLGVEVLAKHIIGDDRERLAAAVRRAVSSTPFVIVSGELRPTEDDVTRDAVALALDRRQIFNAAISEAIEERFRKNESRHAAAINKRQAMVIEGARILANDRGTAPGQWIEHGSGVVMILPGPPHELKSMFTRQCLPRLERIVPPLVIRTLVLRVSGMSESDLDQTISPIYKPYENPVTTVLAHNGDIQVHLRARCATEGEAMALLAEVGGRIDAALGDRIYSRNGDPLEVVVGRKLSDLKATVVVAESATGGGLAQTRSFKRAGELDVFSGRLRNVRETHENRLAGRAGGSAEAVRGGEPGDGRGHGDRRAASHGGDVGDFDYGERGTGHGRRGSAGGFDVYRAGRAARYDGGASGVAGERSGAREGVRGADGARHVE